MCRRVESDEVGTLSFLDVREILPVAAVPGDAGPVTFVALVRNLPRGKGRGAFLLRPEGGRGPEGRLPLELDVPVGYDGRQIALQAQLRTLPVRSGGWYEVAFEWQGSLLATNRFAVGVRG